MSLLSILLLLLLQPTGFVIFGLLRVSQSILSFSLSWFIGSAVATGVLFFLLVMGLRATESFWITTVGIIVAAIWGMKSAEYQKLLVQSWKSLLPDTSVQRMLCISIVFLLCFIFVMNQFWPHTDWDAMTLYDFRAKAVIETSYLSPLLTGIQDVYLISYPWYTSGLFILAYFSTSWNILGVFSFMTFFFLCSIYQLCSNAGEKKLSGYVASLSVLTIPIIFSHTMIAYTNLAFMMYWALGIVLLLSWIRFGDDNHGILGATLFGLSSWVRSSEPFWVIGVGVLILGILLAKKPTAAFWISLILLPKILWKYYVGWVLVHILPESSPELLTFQKGGETSLQFLHIFADLEKWKDVSIHILRFAGPLWGAWSIIVFLLLLGRKWSYRELTPFSVIFVSMSMIFVGTFLFTANPYWNTIIDSFQRLLLFLLPVFVYTVCSSPTTYEKH